jgi:hypothetical protein
MSILGIVDILTSLQKSSLNGVRTVDLLLEAHIINHQIALRKLGNEGSTQVKSRRGTQGRSGALNFLTKKLFHGWYSMAFEGIRSWSALQRRGLISGWIYPRHQHALLHVSATTANKFISHQSTANIGSRYHEPT